MTTVNSRTWRDHMHDRANGLVPGFGDCPELDEPAEDLAATFVIPGAQVHAVSAVAASDDAAIELAQLLGLDAMSPEDRRAAIEALLRAAAHAPAE